MLRSIALVLVLAVACNRPEDPVARGSYVVMIAGCRDCHGSTFAGAPDTPHLSLPRGLPNPAGWAVLNSADGTVWAGPWGITYGANLTPDATGLGAWTPELFIQAMRSGKHMGSGRAILPPMPWESYGKMTDDDLRAIFAYLRTLKPVANVPPGPVLP